MQITDVDVMLLRYTLAEEHWDAHLRIPFRDCLLVLVDTEDGFRGIGEAAVFGGAAGAVASVVQRQLAPLVVGQNPLHITGLWQRMYDATVHLGRAGITMAAISGIDIALWDIAAKVANLPLYQMLGGSTDRLTTYASGGLYSAASRPSAVAAEVAGYQERGFAAAKIKVAGLSRQDDVLRIEAVRDAVDDGFDIMVDANCGYKVTDAISFAKQIRGLGVRWLEEPVRADDIDGSVEVARRSPVPIAGYESESSRFAFREMIARGAVDVVQADAIWAGGITNVRKISDLADAWHRDFTAHVYTSAVALAANMHLMAACPNHGPLEFDGQENPLRDAIVQSPITVDEHGHVSLPALPGLGVDLDPHEVDRLRIEL